MELARFFLAIAPDELLRGQLASLCATLKPRFATEPWRWVASENYHLTLAFIGDVPEARLSGLVEALGAVAGEAFRLEVDKLGYWRHNRIVWAGCARRPAALDRLVADLRRSLSALGLPADDTPFVPHVSLLRKAVEHGCWFTIDSDAHSTGQLEWQPFGCNRAAEVGVPLERVLNTLPVDALLAWTRGE